MTVIGAAILIGINYQRNQPAEVIHPSGPMIGEVDEQRNPTTAMPTIIFVPAYEECPQGERVLLGNPLRVVDHDGNVVYHWMYECKATAWNRTPTTPNCTYEKLAGELK